MGNKQYRSYILFSAAFVSQIVTIGMPTALSVMYAELIIVFDAERWKVALIQGISFGLTVGAGVLWTMVIQKIGIGATMLLGTLLGGVGLFTSAFATSISFIIVLTGICTGIGFSGCYLSSYMVVNCAFRHKPNVPLTLVSIGSSAGQIIMPLFVELLIQKYFWSGTFILMAGMAVQCLPCAMLIYVLLPNDSSEESKDKKHFVFDETLRRNMLFWFLSINLLLFPIAGMAEQVFMVDQLQNIGHPRQDGSIVIILRGCANFFGRIYGSIIKAKGSKYPTIYHWLYLYIVMALCHLILLWLFKIYTLVVVMCVLEAVAFGTIFSLLSTITMEIVGKKRYPAALVMMNGMLGLGILCNNILGGIIKDYLGSYDVEYYIAVGACGLSTLSNIIVCIYATSDLKKRGEETYLMNGNSLKRYSTLE